jgi:hypothetical protein
VFADFGSKRKKVTREATKMIEERRKVKRGSTERGWLRS